MRLEGTVNLEDTMKKAVFIVMLILPASAFADNNELFAEEFRRLFQLEKITTAQLKDSNFKMVVATIYTALKNTRETRIHQMGGEFENKVFLHKDGHREAVYDANGKLVTDCPNKGTYNYYHPHKIPLGHFTADILPWLLLGSCRDDSTTRSQRIEAYMFDFREGFKQIVTGGQEIMLPADFGFKSVGQSEAISFFLKALDQSGYNRSRISSGNYNNKDEREVLFKAIEDGFKNMLHNV